MFHHMLYRKLLSCKLKSSLQFLHLAFFCFLTFWICNIFKDEILRQKYSDPLFSCAISMNMLQIFFCFQSFGMIFSNICVICFTWMRCRWNAVCSVIYTISIRAQTKKETTSSRRKCRKNLDKLLFFYLPCQKDIYITQVLKYKSYFYWIFYFL